MSWPDPINWKSSPELASFQRPTLYLLAHTQWAAVTTCLWVTRLPPHRTEMGPELCRLLLVSFLSIKTFHGAFSAQLETPPKMSFLIGPSTNCQFVFIPTMNFWIWGQELASLIPQASSRFTFLAVFVIARESNGLANRLSKILLRIIVVNPCHLHFPPHNSKNVTANYITWQN